MTENLIFADRDYLCFPFIFLCRHSVEIVIKKCWTKKLKNIKYNDNLFNNWITLQNYLSKRLNNKNVNIALNNMTSYIFYLVQLDSSSTRNRYSIQKNKLSYTESTSIDIDYFYICYEKFAKQINIFNVELDKVKVLSVD